MEQKMTTMSNVSQSPSLSRNNDFQGRNFKNLTSKKKSEYIKEILSTPDFHGAKKNAFYKLKSVNEASLVDVESPRFNKVRAQLKISKDEIQIKKRNMFLHDENGHQVAPKIAKLKFSYHKRQILQTYNLILEERNKEMVREYYTKSKAEYSKPMLISGSPDESYKGLLSNKNNQASMFANERASLDLPLPNGANYMTSVNLNDVSVRSMRHLDRKSRQKKLNSIRKN